MDTARGGTRDVQRVVNVLQKHIQTYIIAPKLLTFSQSLYCCGSTLQSKFYKWKELTNTQQTCMNNPMHCNAVLLITDLVLNRWIINYGNTYSSWRWWLRFQSEGRGHCCLWGKSHSDCCPLWKYKRWPFSTFHQHFACQQLSPSHLLSALSFNFEVTADPEET